MTLNDTLDLRGGGFAPTNAAIVDCGIVPLSLSALSS